MPTLAPDEARRRFAAARVARLATIRPDGRPHLVPLVFAVHRDRIHSAVDAKPKGSQALARLRNIAAEPRVTLLVDGYDENWQRLWWVRADGRATIVEAGPERDRAIGLLVAKYPQYSGRDGDFGSAIVIDVDRWSSWAAT
jgi:PPOX class probable F420-dependent enzyme